MAWDPADIQRLLEPIPSAPGVYLMRDRRGAVLYVGKAVNLKARVRQYFQPTGDPRPFVSRLSEVLDRIETVVTRNETEALILENEWIKRHRPPFNVLLRDDKTYLYLRLGGDGEAFPRLTLVRRRKDDGARYFGPYASAASVRRTHALVNRHFGLRTCDDGEFRNRSRPCLEHQMGRCPAPCVGAVTPEAYRERVDQAALFLRGHVDEVQQRLQQAMQRASEAENFEEAARLRDRIRAIQAAMARQAVVLPSRVDEDLVGVAREGEAVSLTILRFEAGVLVDRVPLVVDQVQAPLEDLADSILLQYYGRAPVPDLLRLPPDLRVSAEALGEVLQTRSGRRLQVRIGGRGPEGQALEMARQNARQLLEEHLAREEVRNRAARRIQELLGLPHPPRRIEGLDLSTFQGGEPVGSLVAFVDGRPDRRSRRTFAVRGEAGPGDVGFLREVLARRVRRNREEGVPWPDLLLIDGGEAQVRAALEVLAREDVHVAIAGLAKARVTDRGFGPAAHSAERLVFPEGGARPAAVLAEAPTLTTVAPPQNDPGLHLLMRVRDEAHRVAVSFHRQRRARRERASVLDDLPGLGKARRTAVLRHFGSVARLRAASLEEIREVPGLPAPVAEALHERLHGEDLPPGPNPRQAG